MLFLNSLHGFICIAIKIEACAEHQCLIDMNLQMLTAPRHQLLPPLMLTHRELNLIVLIMCTICPSAALRADGVSPCLMFQGQPLRCSQVALSLRVSSHDSTNPEKLSAPTAFSALIDDM